MAIKEGCEASPLSVWKFGTLTFASSVCLDNAMGSWEKFRKWHWRKWPGNKIFRVIELTKKGNAHIHFLTDSGIPIVGRIDKVNHQTLASWLVQLKGVPAHASYLDTILSQGFGPIIHTELVKEGPGGAASYLCKYLSKLQGKSLVRPDGRRIRLAEGSRNWNPKKTSPEYLWDRGMKQDEGLHAVEVDCRCDKHRKELNWFESRSRDVQRDSGWAARVNGSSEVCQDWLDVIESNTISDRRAQAKLRRSRAAAVCGIRLEKCEHEKSWEGAQQCDKPIVDDLPQNLTKAANKELRRNGVNVPLGWLKINGRGVIANQKERSGSEILLPA